MEFVEDAAAYTELAELVIDIAREIQVRAVQTTPVIPLTQTHAQVMRYIHRHPGCSASDIADGGGLQRANVSTVLRELRGRGYVTSHRDEADGRAIRIHATDRADENIARLRASWASLVSDAWRHGAGHAGPVPSAVATALVLVRAGLEADRADRARKAFRSNPPADPTTGEDSSDARAVYASVHG